MRTKRVTIKQIAEEAGVSIATVSYVLNGRTDQKIGEQKRKKILQLANLYHYVKNPSASSLATGRTGSIYVVFPEDGSLLALANRAIVLARLSEVLSKSGLRASVLEAGSIAGSAGYDAVIAIGLSQEGFGTLAEAIFVPIIGVDCLISDDLFNDVSDDLSAFLGTDSLISLPVANAEYARYLEKHFRVTYVRHPWEALAVLKADPSAYVRDPSLFVLAKEEGLSPRLLDCLSAKKAEAVLERVLSAIGESGRSKHLLIA